MLINTQVNIDKPNLRQISDFLGAKLIGKNLDFNGFSIDTRTIKSGNLFIAIKGENFDGHSFTDKTKENNACGLIVSKKTQTDLPQIIVKNTFETLIKLASLWRDSVDIPVVAITGSNGKTTVKEMIASVLSEKSFGLKTLGNLNNIIGVSLTLLRLNSKHKWAVIEMGANRPNEILDLVKIAKPTIGVINNISNAHQEGFGNIETTAITKGAVYSKLPENGIAIIPDDSRFKKVWHELKSCKNALVFGESSNNDIYFDNKTIYYKDKSLSLNLSIDNKHMYFNASCVFSIAISLGYDFSQIKKGLEKTPKIKGRLIKIPHSSGALIIDDTYNASPSSVKVAIDFLKIQSGVKILVLADMTELGKESVKQHIEIGRYAKESKIDKMFGFGELSQKSTDEFKGEHFFDKKKLCQRLYQELKKDRIILVKGSRVMRMEEVIMNLLQFKEVG